MARKKNVLIILQYKTIKKKKRRKRKKFIITQRYEKESFVPLLSYMIPARSPNTYAQVEIQEFSICGEMWRIHLGAPQAKR